MTHAKAPSKADDVIECGKHRPIAHVAPEAR